MPNHCHNDLWINGTAEKVAEIFKLIGADKPSPEFDFNTLIPYPQKFREMDESAKRFSWRVRDKERDVAKADHIARFGTDSDGFNAGGYEWCLANWGTKWGAYEVVRRDYLGACLTFQTAWSPSPKIVIELAKRFPTVSFSLEYFERGMCLAGGMECPSEEDWYEDDKPWEPGIVRNEWSTKKYRGNRGG